MGQQVHDPVTDCLSSSVQDQLGSLVTWAPTPALLPGTFPQRGCSDQRGGRGRGGLREGRSWEKGGGSEEGGQDVEKELRERGSEVGRCPERMAVRRGGVWGLEPAPEG